MTLILVGLCIVMALALIYLLIVLNDADALTKQLRFINQHDTNGQLNVKTRNHHVVTLAREVDQLLARHRDVRRQSVQTKNQLDLAIHNISHDLRTPLTVASGYAQLLVSDETLPATTHEQATRLDRNLETLTKHLDLLLLYNRLIENRITITPKSLNLSTQLQQACLNVYDALQQHHINVTLAITPNVTWQLDEEAMNRIFQNILGNILDHGYQTAEIQLTQDQTGVTLTVTNGLQTPIKDAERLIDKFYTEDLSHQKQNAGLGLYIISELTHLQHGEMSISTTQDQFKISIRFTM